MNLLAQSKMVDDHVLIGRTAAAAAGHGIRDALQWAISRAWVITAAPGWATRYAAALGPGDGGDPAAYLPTVGGDPDVITDAMILESVGTVISAERAAADAVAAAAETLRREEAEAARREEAEARRAAEAAALAEQRALREFQERAYAEGKATEPEAEPGGAE